MTKVTPTIISLFMLTGCQTYSTTFDCPPCRGVPCTSVSTIESMIVETPDGYPDQFTRIPHPRREYCGAGECGSCDSSEKKYRVWISEENTGFGGYVEGHFIYFNDQGEKGC